MIRALKQKFAALLPALNERGRRLAVAAEARALGYGGVAKVARASGVSASGRYGLVTATFLRSQNP